MSKIYLSGPMTGWEPPQRWHPQKTPIGTIVQPHSEGDFVRLSDHLARVAQLQAEVDRLRESLFDMQQHLENASFKISTLQADADQYRAECDNLQSEVNRLRAGLQDIAEPVAMQRREAEEQGRIFDGLAALDYANNGISQGELARKLLSCTP